MTRRRAFTEQLLEARLHAELRRGNPPKASESDVTRDWNLLQKAMNGSDAEVAADRRDRCRPARQRAWSAPAISRDCLASLSNSLDAEPVSPTASLRSRALSKPTTVAAGRAAWRLPRRNCCAGPARRVESRLSGLLLHL